MQAVCESTKEGVGKVETEAVTVRGYCSRLRHRSQDDGHMILAAAAVGLLDVEPSELMRSGAGSDRGGKGSRDCYVCFLFKK